jgi:hypothetical protein
VAIVHVLGYLPSTILFTLAITARLGYRRPLAFASALLFAVTVVIVFRAMLHVRIPPGQIYDYLPDAIRGFALIYL